MNYPVWQLDFAGGGLLIAVIATVHVYVSHFAVGGGLFLVLTEMMGIRKNDPGIVEYVHRHSRFFLLLTMVFGAVTGVAIWITIALLSPAATSVLIHHFVFGFAAEWVFFLIEIVALFIYYYTFGRMDNRRHVQVGWIYFISAWMSLFIISGIIDFMLTPGQWIVDHDFWSGFFNPTFWPALFFRTCLALIFAGLFGLITSTAIADRQLRRSMIRYCALWLLLPFIVLFPSTAWYRAALPPELFDMIFHIAPAMRVFIRGFVIVSALIIFFGLLTIIGRPRAAMRPLAFILLAIGLIYMGTFEFTREGGRRPYILRNYMYSNAILKKDLPRIQKAGVLKSARWVTHRSITDDNHSQAGREIFGLLCLPCHSLGGPLNDIRPLIKKFSPFGMEAMLTGMGKLNGYMPPFAGNEKEKAALADFLSREINKLPEKEAARVLTEEPVDIPPFDPEKDEYILAAWSRTGMRNISDAGRYFSLMPPGTDLSAQLIKRGETPEIVTEGVTLHYEIEPGFENPSDHVAFWDTANAIFGVSLTRNSGLSGNGMRGNMTLKPDGAYSVSQIPVVPYPDRGGYQPYPRITIKATNQGGDLIAVTRVVAPVSTEMGCKNCHGGPWRVDGRAGMSDETALDILKTHDKISRTDLYRKAKSGKPVRCQDCHSDSNLPAKNTPDRLNLSAAIHGFHATFLSGKDAESCTACHPGSPSGSTRSLRGIHQAIGLDCTSCHGSMEDHTLSLLKAEQKSGKKRAAMLARHLTPRAVDSMKEIHPRRPWDQEPDCLNCHIDFEEPDTDTTFNTWTEGKEALYRNRTEESEQIFCAVCHNSPHAIYPTENPYGRNRDNIQPMQYQKMPLPLGANRNCKVCHTVDMEDEMHHPNMLREFRNE
ncbi:MAG: cytochrome C [Deltaproteobacteria bacterium]|nr:MAG: cytochrome C [Deltaproteobacteria bacterium]